MFSSERCETQYSFISHKASLAFFVDYRLYCSHSKHDKTHEISKGRLILEVDIYNSYIVLSQILRMNVTFVPSTTPTIFPHSQYYRYPTEMFTLFLKRKRYSTAFVRYLNSRSPLPPQAPNYPTNLSNKNTTGGF